MKRIIKPGALVLALALSFALNAKADPAVDLSQINLLTPYAEFGNNLDESLVTINGNVGVSNGGTLTVMAPVVINGNVDVGTGATLKPGGTIHGTITTGLNLAPQQAQVFTASSYFSGLAAPPSQTFSTISSAESFSAAAGTTTVVDVTGSVNLNNANISFTGPGDLVLNVGGGISLVGSASILTSDPSHVFINDTGTAGVNTHVGDTIDGLVFIPNGSATLDGTFNGGLYGGTQTITLMSGATLTTETPVVPEGSTIWLLAAVGLFTGCTLVRRTRRASQGC